MIAAVPGEEVYGEAHHTTGPPVFWAFDPHQPIKWKNVLVSLAALVFIAAFGAAFFIFVTNSRKIDSITASVDTTTAAFAAKTTDLIDMMNDMEGLLKSFRTVNTTAFVQDIAESARSSRVLMKALRRKRAISVQLPFIEGEEEDEESTSEDNEPEEPEPPSRGNRPKPRDGNV